METFEVNKPKRTGYVICSRTLKEMKDAIAYIVNRYDRKKIYEYNIDRSDISEEQKKIQNQNGWYKNRDVEIRMRNEQIYNLAKKLTFEKLYSGCQNNIEQEVFDEVYNTPIRVIGIIERNNAFEYDMLDLVIDFGGVDPYGEDNDKRYNYSDNIKEFEEKLKGVKYRSSFRSDTEEYTLLENVSAYAYPYTFENVEADIKKQIKKLIRNELTYCLKRGKSIVPQEYLDRKEEGIAEWRKLKSSSNKNNSIEKRMLQQIVRDKKRYAYDCMVQIQNKITTCGNQSWKMPRLEIDGRYNKQRTYKLVMEILGAKDNQFYIELTEKQIENKFKEYWKNVLTSACNEIDEFKIEDYRNGR